MPIDKLDNRYIDDAISDLVDMLGIKEEIDSSNLLTHLRKEKIEKCIENIAKHLGLPIAVKLSYVPADYKPPSSGSGNNISFTSRDLVKTDATGKSIEGIVAQVLIPRNLPLYGTPRFKKFPIDVKISENCKNHPKTFLAIMAHELSHIVLYSIWHKKKDNEIYTDLTAMLLGFSQVIKDGREVTTKKYHYDIVETTITTYGHLNDEQFNYATNAIYKILKEQRLAKKKLLKKISFYKKLTASFQKEYFLLKSYSRYLGTKRDISFDKKDAQKIIAFHQPIYIDNIISTIKTNKKALNEMKNWPCFSNHYRKKILSESDEKISNLISNLETKLTSLNKDASVMKKYVNILYRLKLNAQMLLDRSSYL